MNKPFRLEHAAELELAEAAKYYEEETSGLGLKFLLSINDTIEYIESFPEAWPIFYKNVRRCMTKGFHHRICYIVCENEILGIALEHTSQEPLYWIDRLND